MAAPGGTKALTRWRAIALAGAVLALASCGGGSDSTTTTSGASSGGATTTVAGSGAATSSSTDGASTSSPASTTTTALEGASTAQRTAPGDGTGTALLSAVRVGRHEGFERIVFEFEGDSMPGYRVQWVDGPITADGSGEPVEVAGEGLLEIVLQPASGVDLSSTDLRITYDGPDRIATDGQAKLLTDLVRTGDFEAVLTWVAGTTHEVPFRVTTLRSPTRIAVDLAT